MTCKDCIHYDVCFDVVHYKVFPNEECNDFKNKSRFVELPCNVGDPVYLLEYCNYSRTGFWQIRDCEVDELTIDRFNCVHAVLNGNSFMLRRFKAVNIKDFGKIVFLTKEEAEKKLKEIGEINE